MRSNSSTGSMIKAKTHAKKQVMIFGCKWWPLTCSQHLPEAVSKLTDLSSTAEASDRFNEVAGRCPRLTIMSWMSGVVTPGLLVDHSALLSPSITLNRRSANPSIDGPCSDPPHHDGADSARHTSSHCQRRNLGTPLALKLTAEPQCTQHRRVGSDHSLLVKIR